MSRTIERATAVISTWGGRPFDDIERMLDEARPDAVFVCQPPYLAAEACIEVVERGLPLFTEKPLAAVRSDVERASAARESCSAGGVGG